MCLLYWRFGATRNVTVDLNMVIQHWWDKIDGLVQERSNTSALAMELRLSCTNPLKYQWLSALLYYNSSVSAMELLQPCVKPLVWCRELNIKGTIFGELHLQFCSQYTVTSVTWMVNPALNYGMTVEKNSSFTDVMIDASSGIIMNASIQITLFSYDFIVLLITTSKSNWYKNHF